MTGELPEGWSLQSLGEVLNGIVGGGTPSKGVPEYFQGSIPLMTVKDMKVARPTETGFNITQEALDNSSAKMIPADTVVIATRMGLGKVVRPSMDTAINQDLKALFPSAALDKSFLELWLISIASRIEAMGTGTTVKGVRLNQIKDLEIPVAPTNEQHRIVEKIETLFARLDKGEEAVREVQKLLKRYRQSILKSAVTGELTADWRAEREGELESGADLLARILKTREENWQGRGKYKVPVEPDTTNLPNLPEGWVWASVDQLSSAVEYGSSSKCSNDATGVPVLRMGNIFEGRLIFDSLKYLPSDHGEFPKLLLEDGDLLFNRTNSAELVGKTAVYRGEQQACSFASYLIRVRLIEVAPELVSSFINSLFGREWVKSVVSQQVGQANVNGTKLKALAVPLPPLSEQKEILERMSEMSSKIAILEQISETELKRSAALRQSILKDAFSGRLVPQDPKDEPASVLLERIQKTKKKSK